MPFSDMHRSNKFSIFAGLIIVMAACLRMPFFTMDLRLSMILMFEVSVVLLCAWHLYRISVWFFAFLILSLVSMFFPFYTKQSYEAFRAISYGIMFIVVLRHVKRGVLLDVLCVIAMLNAIALVLQVYNLDPFFNSIRGGADSPVGLIGNRNFSSAILGICFPAFFRSKRYFLLPLCITGLILSKSFGGIAAAAAATFIFLACNGFKWLSIFVPITSFILFYFFIDHPGIYGRWLPWKQGFLYIQKHQLFGYGIGHWKMVFKATPILGVWYTVAHNEPLQAWFEMGIFAPIIIIGYLISVVKKSVISDGWTIVLQHRVIVLSGMSAVLVNSLVNFPFHIAPTAISCLIWMAIERQEWTGT